MELSRASSGPCRDLGQRCGDRILWRREERKLGLSPEELAREFTHLSLSQIHDALSFYYEHKQDMDREIDEESEENLKGLLSK